MAYGKQEKNWELIIIVFEIGFLFTKVPETEETETETETKITETATSETSTSETPSSENSKKSNAPKTGDTTDRTVEVSVLLLSGTVLLAFWKKNRKSKKSNE